jgi:lipid-A-disaccharide synthase
VTRSFPQPGSDPLILISCGEASGDLYAGALVEALRAIDPGVRAYGFGSERLRAAGAELIGDFRGFSVTGLVEALAVLPRSYRMLRKIEAAARERRPDVFVAVDFPDFNFRLLPAMRRLGIPVVYYVSPQVWAWRKGRVSTLRRFVRKMLVIFPFEKAFYDREGVPADLVGHPLVDLAVATRPRAEMLAGLGLAGGDPVVALLPGSRPNEVSRLLPEIAGAVAIIRREVPRAQFVVARAPGLDDALFEPIGALQRESVPLAIVTGETDNALAASDIVLTASGTATIQAALHGRPMVILYRLSPLTYALGRRFVRVSSYGMVNLVAGRPIVPELIQSDCTADRIAREAISLLTDRARAEKMREDLAGVRSALGAPGASRRAAEAVLRARQTVED